MSRRAVYQCRCPYCLQTEDHPEKELHAQTQCRASLDCVNLFLSRLDEQQRRWYVALEAKKSGHGGMQRMSLITGLHVETIRTGRRELEHDLVDRPLERVRLPGGGRPRAEKKDRA